MVLLEKYWHLTITIILISVLLLFQPKISAKFFPFISNYRYLAWKKELLDNKQVNHEKLAQLKEFYSPGIHEYNPTYIKPLSKLELVAVPKEQDQIIIYKSNKFYQSISMVGKDYQLPPPTPSAECHYESSLSRFCFGREGSISISTILSHDQMNRYYVLFSLGDYAEAVKDHAWLIETYVSAP